MIYNKLNLSITDFCAKKDDSREELKTVLFKKDRTVATDSYTLIEVKTPNLKTEDYPNIPDTTIKKFKKDLLVPVDSVEKMFANIPKNPNLPILENIIFVKAETNEDTTIAEFVSTNLETANKVIAKTINSNYPDYRQIIPKTEKPKIKISLNPKYLKRICDFWVKNDKQFIDFELYGDEKPIIAKNTFDGQEVIAMIMPRKS